MSAPAAKALALPVMTTAPIASSFSKASSAWPSSRTSASQSAFSACGRFSVIRPTDPRVSTRILVYAIGPVLFGKQGEGDPEVAIAAGEIEMQRLGLARPGLAGGFPTELRQGRGVKFLHRSLGDVAARARLDDA